MYCREFGQALHLQKHKRKTTHLFWFSEQSNPSTDDSFGVAPAARLSADWVLRRGARHLVHSRQIIINFAADRVLRGGSADRGVHAAYLDAYFVVMLCFKFVYAVLCGILRYLSFVVSS